MLLTLQNHFNTGTDIDQMFEIGWKMARNNTFATLSVTGIKKPLDNQGVLLILSGPDGTRTRDLRRDRAAF